LEMGVSWTICLDWPWTLILPISAPQVARITGVRLHWFHCNTMSCTFYAQLPFVELSPPHTSILGNM
jgi:hypothetical protein